MIINIEYRNHEKSKQQVKKTIKVEIRTEHICIELVLETNLGNIDYGNTRQHAIDIKTEQANIVKEEEPLLELVHWKGKWNKQKNRWSVEKPRRKENHKRRNQIEKYLRRTNEFRQRNKEENSDGIR